MNNIPQEFYDDGELSDDYLWLRQDNSCKQITFKRRLLEKIAYKYYIVPQNYKNKRMLEYPPIEDQLDLMYHSGFDAWKAKIKETKDKYPKP